MHNLWNGCNIFFRLIEIYPEKIDGTPHHALRTLSMSKIQSDIYVANDVAIDATNDVLPVWWMEEYPFLINQSKS